MELIAGVGLRGGVEGKMKRKGERKGRWVRW